MRWFDKWIEKMYLKKHSVKDESAVEATKPNTCVISVKIAEPKKIQSCVSFQLEDLEYLDEDTLYEQAVKAMMPILKSVIGVKCSVDPIRREATIFSEILAYEKNEEKYNWYQSLSERIPINVRET